MKRVAELERKLINYRMEYLLSCKILSLDYELTENQVYLDLKSGASFAVKNYKTIDHLIQNLSQLCCQAVLLVVSGIYLLFAYPILLILILIGTVGQIYLNNRLNGELSPFFQKLFPINRRFDWLNSLKLDLGRQKDIRLFGMKDLLYRKIEKYNQDTCVIFGEMNDVTYKTEAVVIL